MCGVTSETAAWGPRFDLGRCWQVVPKVLLGMCETKVDLSAAQNCSTPTSKQGIAFVNRSAVYGVAVSIQWDDVKRLCEWQVEGRCTLPNKSYKDRSAGLSPQRSKKDH